jgi:hypothetical protein
VELVYFRRSFWRIFTCWWLLSAECWPLLTGRDSSDADRARGQDESLPESQLVCDGICLAFMATSVFSFLAARCSYFWVWCLTSGCLYNIISVQKC